MRRFWTYVGAVLPLAMSSEYASGSVNPHSEPGQKKFPGHSDALDGEEEGGNGQNHAAEGEEDGSPAGIHEPGKSAGLESGNDAVTQEIRGLLNELDRMNDTAEMNSPPPAPVYGPASSEMYAPTSSSAGSSGGGSNIAALAGEGDDPTETGVDDPVEIPGEPAGSEAGATDVDSMMVMLGGAAGGADGTMTDGDIDLEVIDYGQVTVAYGKAEFVATAEWDGTGDPPPAYAETFLDVYDADLVFFYHVDEESENGSEYTESSTLYVVAVDFEDDHPLANEFDMTDSNGYHFEGDPGLILAAYGAVPVGGFFSHPVLDGIPYYAFSRYYGDAEGDVHIEDTGADINFISTTMNDSEDPLLIGDANAIEDIGSSADLVAQTDYNGLDISVSGFGPDTYTSIDAQILEVDGGVSGITGLAIGIA
jgi:hypothetical protein